MLITLNDFKPAKHFALRYGVKGVVYSTAGQGKTPICATTAPRVALIATEPGLLSMRTSEVLTIEAYTSKRIDECIEFFKSSAEAKNFDTVLIDSASEMCEIKLRELMGGKSKGGEKAHGLQAYGAMSMWAMEHLSTLYFMQQKHVVLITKMQNFEVNEAIYKRPYFPGREMPVKVPHLFDLVMQLGTFNIGGGQHKAFLTQETFDSMARDRSGNLDIYEPPHLGTVFTKCMQ